MRHEYANPISVSSTTHVSFTTHRQSVADLLNQALACHMHFEHHQLVCSENAFVIPALDSVRACYLTRVNPLASLEPYPLQKPPRA